jgi:hypothetical protein
MFKQSTIVLIAAITTAIPLSASAECMAIAFRTGEEPKNPIYKVLSCRPAKEVIDQLRQSNRNWYGDIQYRAGDVAISVSASNEDATKYLGSGSEYWHFASGCSDFPEGRLLVLNELKLDSRCCDLGPVRDVQCGLGGKRLLEL